MIAQCLLTIINTQRFLCTVIKSQVVNEAIQSSSSSAFISNFNLSVIMPFQCGIDNKGTFNRLFQGRNLIPHYQFSPVSTL